MKIEAVFFDLDDTLIDSRSSWARALDLAYAELIAQGAPVSRPQFGAALKTVLSDLLGRCEEGELTMAQVRDERCPALVRHLGLDPAFGEPLARRLDHSYIADLKPFEDAAVLAQLGERIVGIVTNGADDEGVDSQRSKLVRFGWHTLPVVLISDSFGCRKPDPRILLEACRRAGVESDRAAFVGDSLANDVAAAKAAGLYAIHLLREGGPTPPPGAAVPDATISTLCELPRLLEAL
jgi:putative hydrolase of the HAD superfamily